MSRSYSGRKCFCLGQWQRRTNRFGVDLAFFGFLFTDLDVIVSHSKY